MSAKSKTALGLGVATATVLGAAGVIFAQGAALPSQEPFLDFRIGMRATDNEANIADPSGTSVLSVADLTFGLDRETRAEKLSLRLGGTFEGGSYADETDRSDDVLREPFGRITYARSGAESQLSFDYNLRERDNNKLELDADSTSSSDLIVDNGTRRDSRLSLAYAVGVDAPFGAEFTASQRNVVHDGATSSLTDERTSDYGLTLHFDPSQTLRLNVNASYGEREEDDLFDTFEYDQSLGLGMQARVDPALTLSAEVAHSVNEVRTTVAGNRLVDRQDQPVYALGLRREMQNGTVLAEFSQEVTRTGRRGTLSFGRELIRETGRLNASFGVTDGEALNNPSFVGNLLYDQKLRDGRISLSLSQAVLTDSNDDDVLRTNANASWTKDLTQVDSLRMGIGYSLSRADAENGTDREAGRVELVYSRALDTDWSLETGVRHRTNDSTGSRRLAENEAFATFGRRFTLRP